MKNPRIHIIIPEWLKNAVQEAAKKKGINMSEYIKDLLKDAVKTESK